MSKHIKENIDELYTVEFGNFLKAFGLAFGQMAHFWDVAFLQSTNKGPERHLRLFTMEASIFKVLNTLSYALRRGIEISCF